jgi:4-hydroxy-tetrahydrodipicolinate synthase
VNISPGVIRRIVEANPACLMLKAEDWPGLEKISALRRLEREGVMRRVGILVGNGGLFLLFELERGADGAMTGYAYPEMLVGACALHAEGRRAGAHDLFDAHLPLLRYERQPGVGLAARKSVLRKRGVLSSDAQRKPRGSLSAKAWAEVDFPIGRLERALGATRAVA